MFVFGMYDIAERHYLSWTEMDGMDGLDGVFESYVPILEVGTKVLDQFETPGDFLAYADGIRGNVTKGCLDEGLVVHIFDRDMLTEDEWLRLQDVLGPTMQVKAVSNKYLLKAKE